MLKHIQTQGVELSGPVQKMFEHFDNLVGQLVDAEQLTGKEREDAFVATVCDEFDIMTRDEAILLSQGVEPS